ncbi:LytTR family DNA-binding domain-containing protein [Sphingopyxis kveilinensis]|uniref:LytTR family DNA-binding domain-containing protein n=1 Tax=Sphingopyxis kveilinensis TaxID=3114367 RepID=UPI0030CDFEE0
MIRLHAPTSRIGWSALILAAWSLVTLAQAGQGYLVAAWRGQAQEWWPTLGYVAAIYSIWALLSWPIVGAALAIERRIKPWWGRIAAYLLLWPVVAYAHVLLFGLVYWPVYRNARIETRGEMADIMFVRNFDTNTMLYLALVAATILWVRWPRPRRAANAPTDAIEIRSRGRLTRIPLDTIDWIGAAGDYAEIHASGRTTLIEESLTSLSKRLPAADFARIHRGALIRIDRVREIEPIARGDAHVRLVGGEQLRLSRRYRDNLAALLDPRSAPAEPAE